MSDVTTLLEIEAIKRLKYKYLRCLDSKDWAGLASCFSDDAVSSYDSGAHAFEGRDKIMEFLENALGSPNIISLHHVHHPEIELTGPDTATGCWYLNDMVIFREGDTELRGAAFYRDEYVKRDGAWRIRFTGYDRTFEEVHSRSDSPSLKITKSMFDGR